jgi:hypothetical protein
MTAGFAPEAAAWYSAPSGGGRLAQLVEHLVYTEGVGGSSPSSPTIRRQKFESAAKNAPSTGGVFIDSLESLV